MTTPETRSKVSTEVVGLRLHPTRAVDAGVSGFSGFSLRIRELLVAHAPPVSVVGSRWNGEPGFDVTDSPHSTSPRRSV